MFLPLHEGVHSGTLNIAEFLVKNGGGISEHAKMTLVLLLYGWHYLLMRNTMILSVI